MKASLSKITALTDSISSFTFTPDQPFSFTAGQYVNVTLTGHHEAGHTAERWFTLSSSPHESDLTITTRHTGSSFKRALFKLTAGDEVTISEAMGDFVLPKLLQTPLVFVAGGIGITPFHSILSWLAATGEQRPIKFLYSVHSESDIIFQDAFEAAQQHVTVVVAEPTDAWGGVRGQLTAEMILGLEQPQPDALIYLSGPEPFVQALQKDLLAHGVSNQNIVVDEFQGYSEV